MLLRGSRAPALIVSFALHLLFFGTMLALRHVVARTSDSAHNKASSSVTHLVWLNAVGPGGGGGGGGNRMKDPPRRAEAPGHDAMTVPATKQTATDLSRPAAGPEPVKALVIPVVSLAASNELTQIGSIAAPPSPTLSQGPGSGGGAGPGTGTGDGSGNGPGLDEGIGGGSGGRVFQPGSDITMPVEIRKGTPRYTSEAMRARVQGSILVECVVRPEGACTDIRVKRSLTPAFGLDEQAIKAAADWRFRPGTRRGQPVSVLVTMEIAFTLR